MSAPRSLCEMLTALADEQHLMGTSGVPMAAGQRVALAQVLKMCAEAAADLAPAAALDCLPPNVVRMQRGARL